MFRGVISCSPHISILMIPTYPTILVPSFGMYKVISTAYYDTPNVTIAATMLLQYPHHVSTMFLYYEPCLSMRFKFKSLLNVVKIKAYATYIVTSKFCKEAEELSQTALAPFLFGFSRSFVGHLVTASPGLKQYLLFFN
jgi:hypothetical protein